MLLALVSVAAIGLDYHIEFWLSCRAGVRFFVNLDFSREGTVLAAHCRFKKWLVVSGTNISGPCSPVRVIPLDVQVRIFDLALFAFRKLIDEKVSSVDDRNRALVALWFNLHSI